jgi:hypothetical protein
MDPANDNIPYEPAFDVRELVDVEEVMEREELGPNGGVLWAMEEVEANFEWLERNLADCGEVHRLDRSFVDADVACRRNDHSRSSRPSRTNNPPHGYATHPRTT